MMEKKREIFPKMEKQASLKSLQRNCQVTGYGGPEYLDCEEEDDISDPTY